MILLIHILGWTIARLPTPLLRGVCLLLGLVMGLLKPHRRRAILGGLFLAYPGRPQRWYRRIYRENAARLIEMGLFVLVLPYLSRQRLLEAVEVAGEARETFDALMANTGKQPQLLVIPHLTLTELMVTLPLHAREGTQTSVGVLFRPLASKELDNWLHQTRGRFGVKLLSRKEGFGQAMRILEDKGIVGLLFDQKAKATGSLLLFQDRVCSATALPGLLAKRHNAKVFAMALERVGFWKARLVLEEIAYGEAEEVPVRAHCWLEEWMKLRDDRIADWLWAHQRWGSPTKLKGQFGLSNKRNLIDLQNRLTGRSAIPRKTPVWIVLPARADAIEASVPFIEKLRTSRPDWAFTVCSPNEKVMELVDRGLAEEALLLPTGVGALAAFWWRARARSPQILLMLDPAPMAARLAALSEAPLRMGFLPGRSRAFSGLTVGFRKGKQDGMTFDASIRRWEDELKVFGLKGD